MKFIHYYTGINLIELEKKYHEDNILYLNDWLYTDVWLFSENFVKNKFPPGEYEVCFYNDKNEKSQKLNLLPAAVLVEFLIEYYKKNKKMLMENICFRTEDLCNYNHRIAIHLSSNQIDFPDTFWDDQWKLEYPPFGLAGGWKINKEGD